MGPHRESELDAFHTEIRLIHIVAVAGSVGLFFVRGLLLNLLGQSWVMAAPVRYVSYAIDSILLAAGSALIVIVRQYPGVATWLTVKLGLLVLYILLGSFALKRGRTRRARVGFWVAALVVAGLIYSIARTRDPLGVLAAFV